MFCAEELPDDRLEAVVVSVTNSPISTTDGRSACGVKNQQGLAADVSGKEIGAFY